MARRGIDMLPLLDVFMVVLFVFATIQETQLDDSVHALDQAHEALARATEERDQQAERAEQLDEQVSQLEPQLERQAARVEELEQLLAQYEAECGPRKLTGPVCPPASVNPDAKAQAEMAALQERLLDNIAVFEIDIEGVPDLTTGELHNRCCFRAGPPNGEWRSCGEVPSMEDEMLTWLDDGGAGLVAGLGRTHGGNAVVLLRQGDEARYRVSNDLAELLRQRMPSHRIYDDGINAGPSRCPDR
jgi:biopolymer transport protein ExbD